ncbi:MAG TPA: late competence development ComFB family protein [Bacillota bacterium]|nr:late competence development ComFB family protein [Bacillota bacterium]
MAKKSNKTEHVLRLITKNEKSEQEDDFFDMGQGTAENEPVTAVQTVMESPLQPSAEAGPSVVKAFREQGRESDTLPEQSGGLVNIAEILAKEKAGLVMSKMKVCTCPTCVNDVLALALNSLPAKYVSAGETQDSLKRDNYKKQYETEILAALTKACVRVKASPRHQEQK